MLSDYVIKFKVEPEVPNSTSYAFSFRPPFEELDDYVLEFGSPISVPVDGLNQFTKPVREVDLLKFELKPDGLFLSNHSVLKALIDGESIAGDYLLFPERIDKESSVNVSYQSFLQRVPCNLRVWLEKLNKD